MKRLRVRNAVPSPQGFKDISSFRARASGEYRFRLYYYVLRMIPKILSIYTGYTGYMEQDMRDRGKSRSSSISYFHGRESTLCFPSGVKSSCFSSRLESRVLECSRKHYSCIYRIWMYAALICTLYTFYIC